MRWFKTKMLEEIYEKQCKSVSFDGKIYFKEKFNFDDPNESKEERMNSVNFVDDGATTDIKMDLAIDEFDSSLRSNLNFSDPESFKILISPLGLEELRCVLHYQLVTL